MRITVMGVLVLIGGILLVAYIVNQLQLQPTANKVKINEGLPNQLS